MSVSIIIPNYNGSSLLRKNIPTVIDALHFYSKNAHAKPEVIIVDDKSSDDSVQVCNELIVKYKDSHIQLIKKEKNEGFSSTVNSGVAHAKGDIVVLLNTDVSPKKDFLIPLLQHFSDSRMFAVGCVDESVEHGQITLRGRGIGEWRNGFLIHKRGELTSDNTLWVSGGSSAYRREMWSRMSGMDTLYNPFYWEDIDLSYRALKAGLKIRIEQKSRVTHVHAEGVIKREFASSYVQEIAYRNQIMFVWKNITDSSLLLNHLLWLSITVVKSCFHHDFAFLKGFLRAVFLLPIILKKRNRLKKHFLISDKGILASFVHPS